MDVLIPIPHALPPRGNSPSVAASGNEEYSKFPNKEPGTVSKFDRSTSSLKERLDSLASWLLEMSLSEAVSVDSRSPSKEGIVSSAFSLLSEMGLPSESSVD